MKIKKWLATLAFVCTFPLLTGCWDRLEIEDRATILGLAIDPIEHTAPVGMTGPYAKGDAPGYKLTAQLAIPGRIPLGPTGGGSTGEEKPVWVVSTIGKTMDDAMNNLQQELADKIFLGHLRVIIVNQKLAQSTGVNDIQDFFRRNAEIRRLAWMTVSAGEASEAMAAAPKLERVPTLYLTGTMDHAVAMGKIPNVFLGNYWSTLSSKGQEPVLPLIQVAGDKVVLEGLAVFRHTRMVAKLDTQETMVFMEITDERRGGYALALPMPGDPQHSVMLKGINRKTKVSMHMEDGKPVFDVYTMIESGIEAKTGNKRVDSMIKQLEKEDATLLTKGQKALVEKMEKLHCDVFGFGEYVRGRNPDYWQKVSQNDRNIWEETFAKTPVHEHVKVFIRRTGMAAK